jgi:hypothetical protein
MAYAADPARAALVRAVLLWAQKDAVVAERVAAGRLAVATSAPRGWLAPFGRGEAAHMDGGEPSNQVT